jgi:RNA polymerase sigma factor (sigma-70 family)
MTNFSSRDVWGRPVDCPQSKRIDALSGGMRFTPFYVAETDSNRPEYFARLLKYLRRKGRSREDAEDLIQEAMLRLHVYAKDDVVVNEEAFLRRAVHNLAIDQYRHDRSGLPREVPIEEADRLGPLIASSPTPDQILENQQRLDCLTALLDAVNPRTREIYFAHRSGYTYAEIADDMGIAEITIRRHIARALLTIREHGEKETRGGEIEVVVARRGPSRRLIQPRK